MSKNRRSIWVNGEILSSDEKVFRAESRGLMYGAGCFETLLSYDGQFLLFDLHIERLNRGLTYLGVSQNFNAAESRMREIAAELLEMNGLTGCRAVIRIQCSLGGQRGFSGGEPVEVHTIVSADRADRGTGGYRLSISGTRAIPGACRPSNLKLSNTLHYMKAWQQASRQSAEDALLLTTDGFVSETSLANLFWKRGNVIYTPSEECDLLPGITRHAVLTLISEMDGLHIEEGRYPPEELMRAELVWVTNSVMEIRPVTLIEEVRYPASGTFFKVLERAYERFKKERLV